MSKKVTYYNFPVTFLDGFLKNQRRTMDMITDYAIAAEAIKIEGDYYEDKIAAACKKLNISNIDNKEVQKYIIQIENGVYNKVPITGISYDLCWDYYKHEKTEWQLVLLLAHLAVKSVLIEKPYTKLNNLFFWSRMDGKAKSVKSVDQLSPQLQQYANEYQTKKIKTELELNWNLVHYGRYTRGFYVSHSLTFDELVMKVEGSRKKYKLAELRTKKNEAVKKALAALAAKHGLKMPTDKSENADDIPAF